MVVRNTQKPRPDVQTKRTELQEIEGRYQRISDALAGEHMVKKRKSEYLPVPSDCDDGGANSPRYKAYLLRANYYNVCQPTRDALVGQIFLRPPVAEFDDKLKFLVDNMNGDGLNLEQMARKAANYVTPFGRGGFITDYPPTQGQTTNADIEKGIRPTIKFVTPWAIRNWRIEKINNVDQLTMLVIDEAHEQVNSENEFEIETVIHQRVYRLKKESTANGGERYCASVEIYDENGDTISTHPLCGHNREPLDGIPFDPIGSENNDMEIDEPPFMGLANLNLAHFRNSADYEESVFLVGQPTPVYSGMTKDWRENYYEDGIPFGSRAAITINEGGSAELLQALPNSMAFEAMKHKEDQMFSVGGKIINKDQKIEKKEKEVEIEAASQKSVLMNIRNNLQMALFSAIQRAAALVGVEVTEENSKLELNENFDLTSADPDELRASSERYAAGEVSLSEHREVLVRSGAAKLDLETFKAEAKADMEFKESTTPKPPEPAPGTVQPGDQTKPKPETKPQNGS